MARSKPYIILAILMVTLLLGSTLLYVFPFYGFFMGLAAAICFVAVAVSFLRNSAPRYRDPYDLRLLKDIHEQKQMDSVDDHTIPEDADVVCPFCGHVHGAKFKVCPMCKRSPGT